MANHHHTMNTALIMLIVALFVGGIMFFWQANVRNDLKESVNMLSDELMRTQEERADSQSHVQSIEQERKDVEETQKNIEEQLAQAKEKLLHTQWALAMKEKGIDDAFLYNEQTKQFFFVDEEGIHMYDPEKDTQFKDADEIDVDRFTIVIYVSEDRHVLLVGSEGAQIVFTLLESKEIVDECSPYWSRDELYSIDMAVEEYESILYLPPRELVVKEKRLLMECEDNE